MLGSILEVPLFTSDSYGSRRIIHTSRTELWCISKAKSSIKSCFGQNFKCVYKVWCQTVALKSWYLYFYPIHLSPHLTWRPGLKYYGISKTRSQFTPGEFTTGFTTHNTASSQSSHYNHLSNPSLMYCRTYVNSHDAVESIIPCDKLHKHQFSFNSDGELRASAGSGNSNMGVTFLYPETRTFQMRKSTSGVYFEIFSDSWCHASDKFPSWIESLFLSNKMIDFKYQTQQKNFHLTWESTFANINAWALTAWGHSDKGVTQNWNGLSSPPPIVVSWATPDFAFFEALHIILALMGFLLCNIQFLFLFLNKADKWRQNTRNESILKTPVATLRKNYRICSKHFTQEAFMNPLDTGAWEIQIFGLCRICPSIWVSTQYRFDGLVQDCSN